MAVATFLGFAPKPFFALFLPTKSAKKERKDDSRGHPKGTRASATHAYGDIATAMALASGFDSIRF